MKSIALSATILFLVLVARAAFVFPLSFLANLTKKTEEGKISIKQQVSILFSSILGLLSSLIRGHAGCLHDVGYSGYYLVGGSDERCCVHCIGLQ